MTTTLAPGGYGIDQLMVEGGGELISAVGRGAGRRTVRLRWSEGYRRPGRADAGRCDGFIEDFPEPELADVERVDDGVVLPGSSKNWPTELVVVPVSSAKDWPKRSSNSSLVSSSSATICSSGSPCAWWTAL